MQPQQQEYQPVPAQPLGYSNVTYGRMPGVITTIGVMSIVVASLGILANGLLVLWSLMAMSFVGAMAARGGGATVAPANAAPMVSPYSLTDSKRQIVIDSLAKMQALTPAKQRHLNELLKEEGKRFLSLPEASINGQSVTQNVTRSGEQDGETWFALGNGRLIVSITEARFEPIDGGETMSASASDSSPEEVANAVIARIEALTTKKLTPAQVKALTKELTAPNQTILSTTKKSAATEIASAFIQPDGTVFLWTVRQSITISPAGVVTKNNFGAGGLPANVAPKVKRAAVMALIDTMISLALALFLLVAAIVTLRQSRWGGKLHWVYVALKIPIVAVFIILWMSEISSLQSGSMASMSVFLTVVMSVGAVYPLALIFALLSPTARGYYSASVGTQG